MQNDRACHVCGLLQLEPPWTASGGSFEICDCCGVEFGYDDATVEATRTFRSEWQKRGYPWFKPKLRPDGWSADEQLANVPLSYR